jgi:hypothetical protein
MSPSEALRKIIKIYKEKVHGKKPDTSKSNKDHDGKKGHWVEDMMGSKRDASNKWDLLGYEMKTGSSKTSFGDWGPNYFIFRDEKKFSNLVNKKGNERRDLQNKNKDTIFLKAFGIWRDDTEDHSYGKWPNGGYYSWSGTPSPTKASKGFNGYGQALVVNNDNSISITYSFSKDARGNKSELVPERFQIENLELFKWGVDWIKEKVENKFSKFGWFKCNMKKEVYEEIMFGKPIFINNFLEWVKNGDVVFDTRMKERRPDKTDRLGMMFRASNSFWKKLAVYKYPES